MDHNLADYNYTRNRFPQYSMLSCRSHIQNYREGAE